MFCAGCGTDIAGGTIDEGPREQKLLLKPANLGLRWIEDPQQEELAQDTEDTERRNRAYGESRKKAYGNPSLLHSGEE